MGLCKCHRMDVRIAGMECSLCRAEKGESVEAKRIRTEVVCPLSEARIARDLAQVNPARKRQIAEYRSQGKCQCSRPSEGRTFCATCNEMILDGKAKKRALPQPSISIMQAALLKHTMIRHRVKRSKFARLPDVDSVYFDTEIHHKQGSPNIASNVFEWTFFDPKRNEWLALRDPSSLKRKKGDERRVVEESLLAEWAIKARAFVGDRQLTAWATSRCDGKRYASLMSYLPKDQAYCFDYHDDAQYFDLLGGLAQPIFDSNPNTELSPKESIYAPSLVLADLARHFKAINGSTKFNEHQWQHRCPQHLLTAGKSVEDVLDMLHLLEIVTTVANGGSF